MPVIMTMVAIRTVFQTLRVRVPSKTPLQVIVTIGATFNSITKPFFELQTPDFAWKFVWTVPTNHVK